MLFVYLKRVDDFHQNHKIFVEKTILIENIATITLDLLTHNIKFTYYKIYTCLNTHNNSLLYITLYFPLNILFLNIFLELLRIVSIGYFEGIYGAS